MTKYYLKRSLHIQPILVERLCKPVVFLLSKLPLRKFRSKLVSQIQIDQPGVWYDLKLIVYLIFGRPFLRSLNPNRVEIDENVPAGQGGSSQQDMTQMPVSQAAMANGEIPGIPNLADDPNNPAALMRRKDATYDQKIDMARTLVVEDPARVANVMKHWVGE